MKEIEKFFDVLFECKYVGGGKKFEHHTKSYLIDFGFKELDLDTIGLSKDDIRSEKEYVDIDINCFVYQPLGTQSAPDFIIIYNKIIFYLECKSSKYEFPTWNGGYPHSIYIYAFSMEKYDSTILMTGNNISSIEAFQEIMKYKEEQKIKERKLNERLLEMKSNPHNIQHYTRSMYNHKGKSKEIGFYPFREEYKDCVFNFLRKKIGNNNV